MNVRHVAWALTTVLAVLGPHAHAEDISTIEIAKASLSPSCLDYRVTGVCFFLECSAFECHINTSARVAHHLPDVVVSSYQRSGENPWTEAGAIGRPVSGLLSQLLALLGGGGGMFADVEVGGGHQTEGASRQHSTVRFKEVDVIGNPIVTALKSFNGGGERQSEQNYEGLEGFFNGAGGGYLCQSEADSFEPYFVSLADPEWRAGVLAPFHGDGAAFVPGRREIGDWPLNTWGPVHPRVGFLVSPEDPKAAAVMAQRVADLVTRPKKEARGRNYRYLGQSELHRQAGTGDCGPGCEPPGPVYENDEASCKWQMLSPVPESTCSVFGMNDTAGPSWANGKQIDDSQDYAWNLWRRYRCCHPANGIFLGAIEDDEGIGLTD